MGYLRFGVTFRARVLIVLPRLSCQYKLSPFSSANLDDQHFFLTSHQPELAIYKYLGRNIVSVDKSMAAEQSTETHVKCMWIP